MKHHKRNREKHTKKQKKRLRKLSKHHLIPVCRGGKNEPVIYLKQQKHDAWHILFRVLTLDEIIQLLLRVKSIKGV